jgi:hypothetical protein
VLPVEIVDVRYDQQFHLLCKPRTYRPCAGPPRRAAPGRVSDAVRVKQKAGVIASINAYFFIFKPPSTLSARRAESNLHPQLLRIRMSFCSGLSDQFFKRDANIIRHLA